MHKAQNRGSCALRTELSHERSCLKCVFHLVPTGEQEMKTVQEDSRKLLDSWINYQRFMLLGQKAAKPDSGGGHSLLLQATIQELGLPFADMFTQRFSSLTRRPHPIIYPVVGSIFPTGAKTQAGIQVSVPDTPINSTCYWLTPLIHKSLN